MRGFVAVFLAGLVLSSCGAGEERPVRAAAAAPVGMTRFSDERRGFEVTFPSSWKRADTVLTPALSAPIEILSVGTVAPVPNGESRCAQHPVATMERIGPRDMFVTIQEGANAVSEGARPGPPRLDAVLPDDSELPACLGHRVPFRTYWMPFALGGRGFYANAAVGDAVPPEGRAELQAVLDSFAVAGSDASMRGG